MSNRERKEKDEPRIREGGSENRVGAIVFTVPPGMVKRLRERKARERAEQEKKEDGADE